MKRLAPILAVLVVLLTIGMIGFRVFTGAESWTRCFYFAVITLTTVGYESPPDMGNAGMIFVSVYLVGGAGLFMYGLTQVGQLIVSDEFHQALEKRAMRQTIAGYRDHLIICGCGQMGEIICEQLAAKERPFVVIDSDQERLDEVCKPSNWTHLHGDATDDEMLEEAGIERAAGLASVLTTDAANLYVVMSAKMLNEHLPIVARGTDAGAGRKLMQAGARHVINPYRTGGMRISRLLLHSDIGNLLEIVDGDHGDLELAELPVDGKRLPFDEPISESGLQELGILVIAIRRSDGTRRMPAQGSDRLAEGDTLLVVGQQQAIRQMFE